MVSSMPLTAILTGIMAKTRPKLSSQVILCFAPLPAVAIMLLMFGSRLFRRSPDDWEGLTRALAPLIGTTIVAMQFSLNLVSAAIVLLLVRRKAGPTE
jgi:hypothetical protein